MRNRTRLSTIIGFIIKNLIEVQKIIRPDFYPDEIISKTKWVNCPWCEGWGSLTKGGLPLSEYLYSAWEKKAIKRLKKKYRIKLKKYVWDTERVPRN